MGNNGTPGPLLPIIDLVIMGNNESITVIMGPLLQ